VRAFAQIYAPKDDGHASERVIERAVTPFGYHESNAEAESKEAVPE